MEHTFEVVEHEKTLPSLLVFLIYTLTSCGQKTFDEKVQNLYRNTIPLIEANDLQDKSNVVILDVRSPEEYEISHIEGSIMIDYDNFEKDNVKNIDKNAEVIVYCSVGYRSEQLGERLQKMGYTHVKNLYGGIFDWKNQGMKVVNLNGDPTDSVHTYNKAWSKWLYKGIKIYE